MPFKFRAAASVAPLAATVAPIGGSPPSAAHPSASVAAGTDTSGVPPDIFPPSAMSRHELP